MSPPGSDPASVAQLGILMDFPPAAAPLLAFVALVTSLAWWVDRVVLEPRWPTLGMLPRVAVVLPAVFAVTAGMGVVVSRADAFWAYMVVLLSAGSFLQGAAVFYILRKRVGLVRRVLLEDSERSFASSVQRFAKKRSIRLGYDLVVVTAVCAGSLALFVSVYRRSGSVSVAGSYAWTVLVGGSSIAHLGWKLRTAHHPSIPPNVDSTAVLSALLFVFASEVANFDNASYGLVDGAFSAVPFARSVAGLFVGLTIETVALYLVSQAAILCGATVAFVFWYVHDAESTRRPSDES